MKRKNIKQRFLFLALGWILISLTALGQVRLPRLMSDGMVLQRGSQTKIWGWAAPKERITLRFKGSSYRVTANAEGEWKIVLRGLKAGGPYTMTIEGSNQITINDVMVGDVWVCSGQSNMELQMSRVSPRYPDAIAVSENPKIRYFAVPQRYDFNVPQRDFTSGTWRPANPQTVPGFSAVAYFFAQALYAKYKVPIGLINASLGGAPTESFMSEDALKEFPNYHDEALRFKDTTLIARIEDQDNRRIAAWYAASRQTDAGRNDTLKPWHGAEIDTAGWMPATVPGYWADGALGMVNGVIWYRKTFEIPASMTMVPAKLILGRIVDADSAFVNGVFVGNVSYQYPPRRYEVPVGVLKEGKNELVVRVINETGRGGFVPDKAYEIVCGDQRVDLTGPWLHKLGAKMEPLAGRTFIRWKPLGLYNAMISPLTNSTIKGVIWYQGESNVKNPAEYGKLFPSMIRNWRDKWRQDDFPFLYVQLANFMLAKPDPSESGWASLRQSQLNTLSVRNTAMAVTIDIGEWNDIHPLNKKDVAARLALAARKLAYGEKGLIFSGPIYKSMKVDGDKVILSFNHVGGGLVAKGGELKEFAVAGEDLRFVWAKAKIKGNTVVVWCESVSKPVAVRYAWADNPDGANLFNKEGLPASPFRTDK